MRACWRLAALVWAAVPGLAQAQPVVPPVVMADPLAAYVKAVGDAPGPDGMARVELLIKGDLAAVRVRSPARPNARILMISTPQDVLTLLADRHMEFLWAPLEEWAGPGLEPMRDRIIARLTAAAAVGMSQQSARTTAESSVRPHIRAVLQLANFLMAVGQNDRAEQLLSERLASMKLEPGGWSGIEWFSVAAGIAKSRWMRGDADGAIAQYVGIESALGDSPYAVNATVNRAAFLAESGRYADALTTVDAAYKRWRGDNREDKIPGSDRQFAWIRACALHGLGREREAEQAFQSVLVDREWHDRDFFIEPDANLRIRGRLCMKQPAALTALMSEELRGGLFTSAVRALQPAYRPLPFETGLPVARADPQLMKIAAERMRVLPPELEPALNGWRQPKLH